MPPKAAPGELNPTFDTDGKLTTAFDIYSETAKAVAVQSDGKLVVAGSTHNGSNDDFALARYNGDGSLDTTFSTDGKLTTTFGSGTGTSEWYSSSKSRYSRRAFSPRS